MADSLADYRNLKVLDLRKRLTERNLSTAGNKPELLARLQQSDESKSRSKSSNNARAGHDEDEIDYSDEEPVIGITSKATATAVQSKAPADADGTLTPSRDPGQSASQADPEPKSVAAKLDADTSAATASASQDFSKNLPVTSGNDEARKRLERAKRFGVVADEETQKRTERARKFGLDQNALTTLDNALPDKPLKRGRNQDVEADSRDRAIKRQSLERPRRSQPEPKKGGASGARNLRERGNVRQRNGHKRVEAAQESAGAARSSGPSSNDKLKLEARKKRFAQA